MLTLESARPSCELRPYVRGYAQRKAHISNAPIFQPSPANLETTLNFQFGDPLLIRRYGHQFRCHADDVVGLHTEMCGEVGLNEMGESSSFCNRVRIFERFLRERAGCAPVANSIVLASNQLIVSRGTTRIPDLARHCGLGLRHFERRFRATMGVTPKQFARLARFQAALDTKVEFPQRSWLEIAHEFRYHDQMHMIHDFQSLGGSSPGRLIELLGDMRPLAVTPVNDDSDIDFSLAA